MIQPGRDCVVQRARHPTDVEMGSTAEHHTSCQLGFVWRKDSSIPCPSAKLGMNNIETITNMLGYFGGFVFN